MIQAQFVTENDTLLVHAPAKINLALLIAGKRSDGFHEIKTVMAKVNWYDVLRFEAGRGRGIELICDGPEWAPAGRENLVYRAIERLAERAGAEADVRVTLTKNIPAGSGLGSASSDAAAALMGYARFAGLKVAREEIAAIGAELGSDIAFFFGGALALCMGRGEKIQEIPQKFDFGALLILPGINTSTKRVYEHYTHDKVGFNSLNVQLDRFLDGKRLDLIAKMCANMLEPSCMHLHHDIAQLKLRIEALIDLPVCLSGSGSTLYCLFDANTIEAMDRYRRTLTTEIGCRCVAVCNNDW